MHDFKELFDKDSMEHINEIIESKMFILKNIPDFNEKEKSLYNYMDEFDQSLPEDLEKVFGNVMRLTYQLEDYYFVLAYLLGVKHGKQIEKL